MIHENPPMFKYLSNFFDFGDAVKAELDKAPVSREFSVYIMTKGCGVKQTLGDDDNPMAIAVIDIHDDIPVNTHPKMNDQIRQFFPTYK